MKKLNYIIVLFFIAGSNLYGQQDVHFSQFFSSPLTLNPANAGIFDGDMRAIMNYRTQYGAVSSEPFVTMAASVDMPVMKKMAGGMFGLGLNFFKDDAGVSKTSTMNYGLSLAYHLDISGGQNNHFLSIGFQGGMIQRGMNYDNLTWNDQWNGETFNQDIYTVDETGGISKSAFDMSSGAHWYYAPSDDKTFFGGFSIFHVNSPDLGFNATNPLLKKYTVHGGGEIAIANKRMAVLPNFVFVKQGANQYMDFGGEVKYFLQESTKFTNYKNIMYITAGPYIRWGDAMYFVSRFNWNGITLAVSYDFNLSDLSVATGGTGGLEVMLGYKMDFNANPSRGHSVRFK